MTRAPRGKGAAVASAVPLCSITSRLSSPCSRVLSAPVRGRLHQVEVQSAYANLIDEASLAQATCGGKLVLAETNAAAGLDLTCLPPIAAANLEPGAHRVSTCASLVAKPHEVLGGGRSVVSHTHRLRESDEDPLRGVDVAPHCDRVGLECHEEASETWWHRGRKVPLKVRPEAPGEMILNVGKPLTVQPR